MNSFESLCEVGAALRMKVCGINAGFCLDFGNLRTLTLVNSLVSPVKLPQDFVITIIIALIR